MSFKLKHLADYDFHAKKVSDPVWDYDITIGPKTKSTRTLLPLIDIVIDHDNKNVIFEYAPEESERGD